MLEINPFVIANKHISGIPKYNVAFKSAQTNPQEVDKKNQITSNSVDYNVKTPMAYKKIEDIKLPFDKNAHVYKFANGQKVVIVPQEGKTVLKTYVNTGSMNETDDIRGISHFIEHNLFNGSNGLEAGQFFKEVDKMGAYTNASTGFAETNYFISSHLLNESDLENKIKLHASMIETPKFALNMLEKEKGIVNSEINMITSNPMNIGINKVLKNLYQIDTKSVDMIGGTTANITNLTREDVVKYFENNYYPANMVTVVTGEVEPEETIKLLSKYFTSTKAPNKTRHFEEMKPIDKTIREDIISDKATATSIMMAFNGPKNSDTKDKIALEALSRILSMSKAARIDKNLRQYNSGLVMETERISAKPDGNLAILMLSDGTEANSEKILKTIYNEVAKISVQEPTEEELNIAKKRMLKSFSNAFELSSATNSIIGSVFQDNEVNALNDYEKIVKDLTPADITETAKKYLDLNKASLTVVHPATANIDSIKANHSEAAKISFTGSTTQKKVINIDAVKEYKLDNNYSVILQNSNNNNATLAIEYQTDNYLANLKPATLALLANIMDAGTKNKTEEQLQNDLDKLVTSLSPMVEAKNLFLTSGYFASEDTKPVLDIAKEMISSPRFTEETLAKSKDELRDAIETSEKSTIDNAIGEIYKGIPTAHSNKEVLKSIDNVTLDDVKDLYNHIINNSQARIVMTAPFEKKPELKQLVFNEFAKMPKVQEKHLVTNNLYIETPKSTLITDKSNKSQAKILQVYRFKNSENIKDELSLMLLNSILGGSASSRLFNDLREKQKLAYSVGSRVISSDDIGTFRLNIATTTENKDTGEVSYDNLKKSIDGFNKHINKIKTEKVSEEELQNAKLSLKNYLYDENETNSDKNISLLTALNSPYGLDVNNLALKVIDEITVEDIYNAANYVFKGKPIYSILATENTLNANQEYLDKLAQ